jgi:hypothetical protein
LPGNHQRFRLCLGNYDRFCADIFSGMLVSPPKPNGDGNYCQHDKPAKTAAAIFAAGMEHLGF